MTDTLTIIDSDGLEDLLSAVASGNRAAFDDLYEATARRLYPIVRRIVVQPDLAEDVLQEAYLTIWRKAGQFDRRKGAAFSWLATIARNRAIDRLRRDDRRPHDEIPLDSADERIEKLIADRAAESIGDRATVRKCLNGLQKNHRKTILCAFFYGMTHEEMSSRFETPLGTIKSWVRRGLHQLKECCAQ